LTIFDAHNHIGRSLGSWAVGLSAEELIERMNIHGVDKAVVISYLEGGIIDNDYVDEAAKKFPNRLIPCAVINPWQGAAATSEFDRCVGKLGMKSIKLHPFLHSYPVSSHSLLDQIFEKCTKTRLPIIIHGASDGPFNTPLQIAEMAQTFPEVPVIMTHMGWMWLVEDAINAAKKCQNIYLETSACPAIWPIKDAIEKLGPDRVVMGTDSPDEDFGIMISRIKLAINDEESRRLVLGENLERLFSRTLK
jgi:predicted TIM-barrel fold metal-dependent hydrolase